MLTQPVISRGLSSQLPDWEGVKQHLHVCQISVLRSHQCSMSSTILKSIQPEYQVQYTPYGTPVLLLSTPYVSPGGVLHHRLLLLLLSSTSASSSSSPLPQIVGSLQLLP